MSFTKDQMDARIDSIYRQLSVDGTLNQVELHALLRNIVYRLDKLEEMKLDDGR